MYVIHSNKCICCTKSCMHTCSKRYGMCVSMCLKGSTNVCDMCGMRMGWVDGHGSCTRTHIMRHTGTEGVSNAIRWLKGSFSFS